MSIKGLHRPGNGNGGCVYDLENSSVLMERLAQRGLRPRTQTQDPDPGPRTQDPGLQAFLLTGPISAPTSAGLLYIL